MSTIAISLPEDVLAFLRAYSKAHGTTAEALLARQARNLREHLRQPVHPDVATASGVVSPVIDGEQAHKDHLEKKHA